MGLKHVIDITAYDHIVFLVALLIPYTFKDWKRVFLLVSLFTLGHTQQPLKGIIYAIVINITVGFILSRFLSFEYSVVGMLIGALFFMLYTLKHIFHFFKKLDYHYYASF